MQFYGQGKAYFLRPTSDNYLLYLHCSKFGPYNSKIGIILEFVRNAESRFHSKCMETEAAFYHDLAEIIIINL